MSSSTTESEEEEEDVVATKLEQVSAENTALKAKVAWLEQQLAQLKTFRNAGLIRLRIEAGGSGVVLERKLIVRKNWPQHDLFMAVAVIHADEHWSGWSTMARSLHDNEKSGTTREKLEAMSPAETRQFVLQNQPFDLDYLVTADYRGLPVAAHNLRLFHGHGGDETALGQFWQWFGLIRDVEMQNVGGSFSDQETITRMIQPSVELDSIEQVLILDEPNLHVVVGYVGQGLTVLATCIIEHYKNKIPGARLLQRAPERFFPIGLKRELLDAEACRGLIELRQSLQKPFEPVIIYADATSDTIRTDAFRTLISNLRALKVFLILCMRTTDNLHLIKEHVDMMTMFSMNDTPLQKCKSLSGLSWSELSFVNCKLKRFHTVTFWPQTETNIPFGVFKAPHKQQQKKEEEEKEGGNVDSSSGDEHADVITVSPFNSDDEREMQLDDIYEDDSSSGSSSSSSSSLCSSENKCEDDVEDDREDGDEGDF